MVMFKKVFGRVQFYNRTSEYFENIEYLMDVLYKQQSEKGLVEYIVFYGATSEGKLYRSVFDFNSFTLEDLALDEMQLHDRKFQKYLGELLLEQKIITPEQIERALAEQAKSNLNERLGEILIRLGYVRDDTIIKALSKQLGLKRQD